MRWLVGDIQGCVREFDTLLREIRFDPARDELWCLGDLVNRGPDSLAVVRTWRDIGGRGLIGNHEVHALLAYSGRKPKNLPDLAPLFAAPDADDLLAMLRVLPVLVHLPSAGDGPDVWAVHAGLDPRWADLHGKAAELNTGPHDDDRLLRDDVAFAVHVRCCTADGERCRYSGRPEGCPPPFVPWDSLYTGDTTVVHGHWAMRGYYRGPRTIGLDSGCVYGGSLTAWCQDEDRIVQIPSEQ